MNSKPVQHYAATSDRRAEIAKAARAIIAELGFEGLRTRDIADRVGINIATLHYHVPSKAALIDMVAESLRDDFIAQHNKHPRGNRTPLERLQMEFDEVDEVLRDNPELYVVYAELLIRARRDPTIAAIMQPMVDFWFGQIVRILTDGAADGSFRPNLDPRAGAAIVIGALTWPLHNGCAPKIDLYAELLRSLQS